MHSLMQRSHRLVVETPGRAAVPITAPIRRWVAGQGIGTGLLTVWCRHTSASLLVQENADPDVMADLADFLVRLAPDGGPERYRHAAEGPDDMAAHIRAALTPPQLTIPVEGGALALGTWQGLYLLEHRLGPHRRELALHLIGAPAG